MFFVRILFNITCQRSELLTVCVLQVLNLKSACTPYLSYANFMLGLYYPT